MLQITDTHLFDTPDGCLLGLNTDQSLKAVIDDASAKHLPADLVLATGDLAHMPAASTYERVTTHLARLGLPVYCLPGNHDESTLLNSAIDGGLCRFESQLQHNGWQFIFLDSTIPGSEGAHFSAERLQQLDRMLADSDAPHTLVCLHHNPVNMGSRWLDTMALDNQDEFFAVIDRHTQVRGILWGHVHQEFNGTRNGVSLMSTPSTCIQFMPGSNEFALDSSAPGYRWLLLHEDGTIETGVERLDWIPGMVDVSASGY